MATDERKLGPNVPSMGKQLGQATLVTTRPGAKELKGFFDLESVRRFLEASLASLHPSFPAKGLEGMPKAQRRVSSRQSRRRFQRPYRFAGLDSANP